ncbi:pentapeptide repeat-containing protein [Kitasatospora sp. NBC_00240]|uniref:pentapeptide repeat-containing protein n=1 Tax=Kitasatospora sp. NBC_00240 TaxID=2903567 RepID=UPI002257FEAD|nr:pentapeptide repeat-containing protein [Kitasatospora sp. NBC_00240]MCX5215831.1 pentapeptide repeat-containing protein [Kitasatospora sp. NBC_00240]
MADNENISWYDRRGWVAFWYVLAPIVAIGAVGAAIWQVPWWIDDHYLKDSLTPAQATTVTGVRTALLAMAAAGVAAVGLVFTRRTLHQVREGQVTDRYLRAISQIASDKPMEQLGGIYALERIMRDSKRDHATVVEVLAAFVRAHAPATQPSAQDWLRRRSERLTGPLHRWWLHRQLHEGGVPAGAPRLPEPVQAALTVLGRRPENDDEPFWINLARTDLRGAELPGARLGNAFLEGANLSGAHLEKATLVHAHLEEAILDGAHLEEANMVEIHLERADLGKAHLEGAILISAHLDGARLDGAHLDDAHLQVAHLDGAHLEGTLLDGAHLDGTQLKRALSLTVDQLVLARPCERTDLPTELATDDRVRARITTVEHEMREQST